MFQLFITPIQPTSHNSCRSLWRLALLVALIITITPRSIAAPADTLRLGLQQAEAVFLQNNLSLLAGRLNIGQAEARIIQAKAWPNPTFTVDELQVYRNSTTESIPGVLGNVWRDRNFAFQLEQLILTAGKRRKNINLETRNRELAKIEFAGLLQALRAEFRQTAYEIQYLQHIRGNWEVQSREVERLLNAQERQLTSGNISEVELFRLRALWLSLRAEINEFSEQMNAAQRNFKTLMGLDSLQLVVIADPLDPGSAKLPGQKTIGEMLERSRRNAKLLAAEQQLRVSEAELSIERANAIPNVNLIANYDRAGSTMRDFVGVGAAVELPFLNRNRGNIRAAQLEVEKSNLLRRNTELEVRNTVVQHWSDLQQAMALYQSIDSGYVERLDTMTLAISRNYATHNLSLLQFLDYYESFRDSKVHYYNAIRNVLVKKEELNYLTGGDL